MLFLTEATFGCTSKRISIKSAYGKYVSAEVDGTVNANGRVQDLFQIWTVAKKRTAKLALRSYHGKYLVAEVKGEVNANRDSASAWETFVVEQLGDGVAFKTSHNTYLSADNSGNLNAKNELGRNERFRIQCLDG